MVISAYAKDGFIDHAYYDHDSILKFIEAKERNRDIEPQDAPKAFFGYKLRSFLGFDIGSQISDQQAKASAGDSKVTVPGYRIARIRPATRT